MPDEPVTPAASPAPTDGGTPPSPAPTDAPGTQVPSGYVPMAELEKAQATARGLQSEKDKLAARVAELSKPAPTEPAATPPAATDPVAMIAAFERRMELREAKAEFRSDERFKNADPSILSRATEYESREALEAALLASAEARTTERQRIEAEVSERIYADLREKYPDLQIGGTGTGTPPSNNGGGTPGDGAMTVERLVAMSQTEFEAYAAKNPEEFARLMGGS